LPPSALIKRKELFLLTVLGLTGFVTSFGAYIVAANLPAYSRETGAGLIIIGLLIALYDIAEILIKPLGGLLSVQWGEWRVLRLGLVVFALASGSYFYLGPQGLIMVRLMQGAGAALFSVMSMTLLVRYFMARKGMALGVYGLFKSAGYVVAPTSGGFVVYHFGFHSVFILCLATALAVLLLTFLINPPSGEAGYAVPLKGNRRKTAFKDLLFSLKDRRTVPIFLIMFFNMVFLAAFFGFLPVILAKKGLDPLDAGILLAVIATVYLVIQPIAGRLSDTLGRKKLIAAGLTLSTLSVPLIPILPQPYYILAACTLALGIGCVLPLGEAFAADVTDEGSLALVLGIAGSYKELGEMAGPLLIGFVGQHMGLDRAFLMVAMAGVLSLICILFLKEKKVERTVEFTSPSC